MPTFTATVAASTDDTNHASITDNSGRAVATGSIISGNQTSALLSPGSHGTNDEWSIGCRFLNVTIPQGSVVSSALFSLKAQSTYDSPASLLYLVSAEAVDDAATFAVGNGLRTSLRPRTTAVSAQWDLNAVVINTRYSIDITSVIQEIVNRPGWVSGNDIVVIMDTDPANPSADWQDFYAWDDATDRTNNPPQISITYTVGGAAPLVTVNRNRSQRPAPFRP